MNTPYNDVDRMILSRWDEVAALRDAYDELVGRMTETIDSACRRTGSWLEEQGYDWDFDAKHPCIWAWKPGWEKPKGEPLITLEITDFAPLGFGKVDSPNPYFWLSIEQLERLKMKEPERARFARELKAAIGSSVSKWDHADGSESSDPLGRYCTDVSDRQRVEMVGHPATLVAFFESGFRELFELVPAIDDTLKKYREPK